MIGISLQNASAPARISLLALLALVAALAGCRREMSMDDRYNQETFEILRRALAPNSVAVDVGAYRGEILTEMVRLAPRGVHHAFEPQPESAAFLRKQFAGGPAVIHELALADRAGTTQFHQVASNPSYSGIKERSYEKKEEIRMITVRVDTLDRVLAKATRVDLIKIDVEGGELGVLRGAVDVLRRFRPIVVFEHGRGAAEYYGTTPDQVYDVFERAGLSINVMQRALSGRPPVDRAEFRRQFQEKVNYYFVAYPAEAGPRLAGRSGGN